jgi:hypothetical protein
MQGARETVSRTETQWLTGHRLLRFVTKLPFHNLYAARLDVLGTPSTGTTGRI